MHYRYRACDAAGHCRIGWRTAADPEDLARRLAAQGLELLRCRPALLGGAPAGLCLGRRERLLFCFQLEQLLTAGLPLLEALTELRAPDMPNGSGRPARQGGIAVLAGQLAEAISGGQSFSAALAEHPASFDAAFVGLIRAGETAGNLPEMLARLRRHLADEVERRNRTLQLLLYPATVAVVVLGAGFFLMRQLVPQLKLFAQQSGQPLPAHSRALFGLADFLAAHGGTLLVGFSGVALSTGLAWRRSPALRARAEVCLMRLPLWGAMLHKARLARFATTFAQLYAAGIPVLEALALCRAAAGHRPLAAAIDTVAAAVGNGAKLSAACREAGLFPPLMLRLLGIGEQTGRLDTALLQLGAWYDGDVAAAVARSQTLIEPFLTLMLGALLGWIMLAVIGPLYGLIGQMQGL
jgi:type IV pilus assembly protein PilC